MQTHLTIDGREKNKLVAQQVGIRAAQESFKQSLKTRSPLFSWDDEPVTLSIVLNELYMHYAKVPSDLTSLQEIVKTSCLIEYANLKSQYKKHCLLVALLMIKSLLVWLMRLHMNF